MANWYVNSVAYAAVAQWAATHTYAAGAIVRQLAAVGFQGERCFRTNAGGVSGSTEPKWSTVVGGVTVADGTVTDWTEITGNETYQAPAAWSAPMADLPGLGISAISPNTAVGTGFAANDLVGLNGGTFTEQCILQVLTVSAGKIQTWKIYAEGVYQVPPGAAPTVTAITGVGTAGAATGTPTVGPIHQSVGDTFYVSSNHFETYNANRHIAFSGTIDILTRVVCVDETSSGHVPPQQSSDLKTTAVLTNSVTGNITNIIGSVYVYGLNCRSGGVFGLGRWESTYGLPTAPQQQVYENCVFSVTASPNSLCIGSVQSGVLKSGQVVWINCQFFCANQVAEITVNSLNFTWRNNGSPAILAGSAAPFTLIAGSNAPFSGNVQLDGLDLSAIPPIWLFGGSSQFPLIYSARNCKFGGIFLDAALLTPAIEAYNYNCDTGNTNYVSSKYTHRGTETTEVSITRVGGATDLTTAQSRKIVTNANSTFFTPFVSMPMMIWNDRVGTTVNFTLYATVNAGFIPPSGNMWLEVEYFSDSASPLASFADNRKADYLTAGTAFPSDTSVWNGGGSGAGWLPFSMTVSFTPQQKGYVVGRVKVAVVSSTFYIDPPGAATLT